MIENTFENFCSFNDITLEMLANNKELATALQTLYAEHERLQYKCDVFEAALITLNVHKLKDIKKPPVRGFPCLRKVRLPHV